jgi:hypothetical protein
MGQLDSTCTAPPSRLQLACAVLGGSLLLLLLLLLLKGGGGGARVLLEGVHVQGVAVVVVLVVVVVPVVVATAVVVVVVGIVPHVVVAVVVVVVVVVVFAIGVAAAGLGETRVAQGVVPGGGGLKLGLEGGGTDGKLRHGVIQLLLAGQRTTVTPLLLLLLRLR